MADFNFFACDGGPHIVLPNSARTRWGGIGARFDPSDPSTDYALACRAAPPVGLIAAGDEQALVFSGSPPMSGWGTSPGGRGIDFLILEAWKTSDLNLLVTTALAHVAQDEMVETGLSWIVGSGGLALMFAGDVPDRSAYGEVQIPAVHGTYNIRMAKYKSELGELWIIRAEPE